MIKIQIVVFGSQKLSFQISQLLRPYSDLELNAFASTTAQLVETIADKRPRVVLLEATPALVDIHAFLSQITVPGVNPAYIILAHDINLSHVRQAFDTGIAAYLLIRSSLDSLISAVRLADSGKVTVSPEITHLLISAP